jgi:hypothetical protein
LAEPGRQRGQPFHRKRRHPVRKVPLRRRLQESRVTRGWTIGSVGERTREAVTVAAQQAGMPVGAWVEQALGKALKEGLESGVSLKEIEARLRRVVSDELQPVWQALARLETTTVALGQPRDNSSAFRLLRRRLRQRRGR